MLATIDIDAQLLREIEQLAHRNGQPLSSLVEQALRASLKLPVQHPAPQELYGEPLTDEEIDESGRVTFQTLDEETKRA